MARDLDEAKRQWRIVRQHGTKIEQLINDAQVAFTKVDGTTQAPDASTLADIVAEAAIVIPLFEDAFALMKAAYTP